MDAERSGLRHEQSLSQQPCAKYFLPSIHEWHKAAFYDPVAGVYYTYTTGSNTVPDGIDFPSDSVFDAVFYDGGLNSNPNLISNVGITGPYGTLGQGGNVDEWLETAADWVNNATTEQRIRVGGSWVDGAAFLSSYGSSSAAPFVERQYSGFRVASVVPEPTNVTVVIIGISLFLGYSRTRRWILRCENGSRMPHAL